MYQNSIVLLEQLDEYLAVIKRIKCKKDLKKNRSMISIINICCCCNLIYDIVVNERTQKRTIAASSH